MNLKKYFKIKIQRDKGVGEGPDTHKISSLDCLRASKTNDNIKRDKVIVLKKIVKIMDCFN